MYHLHRKYVAELSFPSQSPQSSQMLCTETSHLQSVILRCNQVTIKHIMYRLAETRPRMVSFPNRFRYFTVNRSKSMLSGKCRLIGENPLGFHAWFVPYRTASSQGTDEGKWPRSRHKKSWIERVSQKIIPNIESLVHKFSNFLLKISLLLASFSHSASLMSFRISIACQIHTAAMLPSLSAY